MFDASQELCEPPIRRPSGFLASARSKGHPPVVRAAIAMAVKVCSFRPRASFEVPTRQTGLLRRRDISPRPESRPYRSAAVFALGAMATARTQRMASGVHGALRVRRRPPTRPSLIDRLGATFLSRRICESGIDCDSRKRNCSGDSLLHGGVVEPNERPLDGAVQTLAALAHKVLVTVDCAWAKAGNEKWSHTIPLALRTVADSTKPRRGTGVCSSGMATHRSKRAAKIRAIPGNRSPCKVHEGAAAR